MRLLFVMLHTGFLRNFEDVVRALAAHGHEVDIVWETADTKWAQDRALAALLADCPSVTAAPAPVRAESIRTLLARLDPTATRSGSFRASRRDATRHPGVRESEIWAAFATGIRVMADALRYREPELQNRTSLRARAEKRLPGALAAVVSLADRAGTPGRRALAALLRTAESVVPVSPIVREFVSERRPDAVLVTPLVEFGSQQVDYVKAAREIGIPSALCVASWDNLTTKGLVRVPPDRVIVWNEIQRDEAVQLHGVPSDRVVVTGAQLFDRWFVQKPRRPRDEFCARVGLRPDRPLILYTGSSSFIAPREWGFAERWIAKIRDSADPLLAGAGVLIRPHPANARQWFALDLRHQDNVAIWPPIGTEPVGDEYRADYFDSLFHCAAVVGVNTSAMIEAAIIGRPVCTVLDAEFEHAQGGTIHFGRLLAAEGGPLYAASSLDEHEAILASLLADASDAARRNREFVRCFLRPHGLDRPAGPIFVGAIEGLAGVRAGAAPSSWLRAVRPAVYPLAAATRSLMDQRSWWAYPIRPAASITLGGLNAGYRFIEVTGQVLRVTGRRAARRARRVSGEVERWWKLSRDRAGKRVRRGAKAAGKAARRVGGGMGRLVGSKWKAGV